MSSPLATAQDPTQTLLTFTLDELAPFTREKAFAPSDSLDFRVFYVGRDDVHGILKYLLSRTSISLTLNMFGYDDEELNDLIIHLIGDEHIFVQGTLDRSQAGGTHESKILDAWTDAVRASFVIGQSASHQISHTKGGVIDGVVAWEGSTNWSASGEGTIVAANGSDVGRKSQNNTLAVYTNPLEIVKFATELNEEHATALAQAVARAAHDSKGPSSK